MNEQIKKAIEELIDNPLSEVELEDGYTIHGADNINEKRVIDQRVQRGILGRVYVRHESDPDHVFYEFETADEIKFFIEAAKELPF